jgi:hypothetical protein
MEFEFERQRINKEDVRELIYYEARPKFICFPIDWRIEREA